MLMINILLSFNLYFITCIIRYQPLLGILHSASYNTVCQAHQDLHSPIQSMVIAREPYFDPSVVKCMARDIKTYPEKCWPTVNVPYLHMKTVLTSKLTAKSQ